MNGPGQPFGERVTDNDPPAQRSRRSVAAVGVSVTVAIAAVAAIAFVTGADDGGDSIQTITSSSTVVTTTTSAEADRDALFTEGTTAPDTVPAPETTTAPTTIAPVETLPEQPAQPIAPPADPRAAEERIELGRISIPKLGVDQPLLSGITLTTLDQGPGHWPGTAMPGEVGNAVVAAHRTSHGAPFRNIDQLVAGDAVLFETVNGDTEYTVVKTEIVNPDALWIVDPTDTPTATLFACHPPGSVAQRIVVFLELKA